MCLFVTQTVYINYINVYFGDKKHDNVIWMQWNNIKQTHKNVSVPETLWKKIIIGVIDEVRSQRSVML